MHVQTDASTLNCLLAVRTPTPTGRNRFVAKDVFDTADMVTTYGSGMFREHIPTRTAVAVTRMLEAGYVLVGKANLHEFAWGATSENPHYGSVRNPLDVACTAGGSSSGSAAAVAAGLCEVALGTDTGGSIRIPAACCGVVGFKPTYGSVPLDGVFPLSPTLDHAGPLGATVRLCWDAFSTLSNTRPVHRREPLEDVRLGILVSFTHGCSPGISAAVQRALEVFPRRAEAPFPDPLAFDNTPLYYAEAAVVHRHLFPGRAEEYGADVARKLTKANGVSPRDYLACRKDLATYRTRCELAFNGFDFLAAPTIPCVAPPLAVTEVELDGQAWSVGQALTRNTRPFNNLGWPVIALPCGEAEEGLPASLSLIGRPGDDQRLLALAEACEDYLRGW